MPIDRQPVRTRQRGRSCRPPPEACRYLVAIEDWDWSLRFGVSDRRYQAQPFGDYRHLQIRGPLLRPHLATVRAVELTLLPETKLGSEDWPDGWPTGAGSLSLNPHLGHLLQGLLSFPADALAPILTMMATGRFKYVLLDGAPLRHRRAPIRHYRLAMGYDEEEFPSDL